MWLGPFLRARARCRARASARRAGDVAPDCTVTKSAIRVWWPRTPAPDPEEPNQIEGRALGRSLRLAIRTAMKLAR